MVCGDSDMGSEVLELVQETRTDDHRLQHPRAVGI